MAGEFIQGFSNAVNSLDSMKTNSQNRANNRINTDINRYERGYDLTDGKPTLNRYGRAKETNRLDKARLVSRQIANKSQKASMDSITNNAKLEAMYAVMNDQQQQLQLQQDRINTEDMTKGIMSAYQGKVGDFKAILQRNTNLKNKLETNLGVTDISAVDWVNDRSLFREVPNLNVTKEHLDDTTKLNALNSLFMKYRDTSGNWHMIPTEKLIKVTGTAKYLDSKTNEFLINRSNTLNSIANGTMILSNNQMETGNEVISLATTLNRGKAPTSTTIKLAKGILWDRNVGSKLSETNRMDITKALGLDPSTKVTEDMYNKYIDIKASETASNIKSSNSIEADREKKENTYEVWDEKVGSKLEESTKEKIRELAGVSASVPITKEMYQDYLDLGKEEKILEVKNNNKMVDFDKVEALKDKVDKGIPLTKEDRNTLLLNSGKITNKPAASAIKTLDSYQSSVARVDKTMKKINNLGDNFDKGIASRVKASVSQYLPDSLINLSDKVKNTIKVDTEIGVILALFIKDMSGTAVTDVERKMYKDIIVGNSWTNKQSLLVKMGSFQESITSSYGISIQNLYANGHYIQYANYKEDFNKYGTTNTNTNTNTNTSKVFNIADYKGIK